MLAKTLVWKFEKSKKDGTSADIKISLTQMRKVESGAVSGGVEKAIKGKKFFSFPQDNVHKLIRYKEYLTAVQKEINYTSAANGF